MDEEGRDGWLRVIHWLGERGSPLCAGSGRYGCGLIRGNIAYDMFDPEESDYYTRHYTEITNYVNIYNEIFPSCTYLQQQKGFAASSRHGNAIKAVTLACSSS